MQGSRYSSALGEKRIRRLDQQRRHRRIYAIGVGDVEEEIDLEVAAFRPAALGQSASHRPHIKRGLRVVFGHCHDSGDPPHAVGRLCPRSERPRSRAAEQRDELASLYSITSSARASRVGGTSRPSALAVARLITSSTLVGNSTGRSAGLEPFRILSTKYAARRKLSRKLVP